LAADVLVYFGDLALMLGAAARVLVEDGLFTFTVQAQTAYNENGEGFLLGVDRRFLHSAEYICSVADAVGLSVLRLAPEVTRQEAGVDVPCLVAVLAQS
jgi:predicted TPR repeat methyltransferase